MLYGDCQVYPAYFPRRGRPLTGFTFWQKTRWWARGFTTQAENHSCFSWLLFWSSHARAKQQSLCHASGLWHPTWLVSLACDNPFDLSLPSGLWHANWLPKLARIACSCQPPLLLASWFLLDLPPFLLLCSSHQPLLYLLCLPSIKTWFVLRRRHVNHWSRGSA